MPRPTIQPRILTETEAAMYAGFRGPRGGWPKWAERFGVRPMPDRDQRAYDLRQLDAAIDRAAGIAVTNGNAPSGKAKWG